MEKFFWERNPTLPPFLPIFSLQNTVQLEEWQWESLCSIAICVPRSLWFPSGKAVTPLFLWVKQLRKNIPTHTQDCSGLLLEDGCFPTALKTPIYMFKINENTKTNKHKWFVLFSFQSFLYFYTWMLSSWKCNDGARTNYPHFPSEVFLCYTFRAKPF